jgi:hypothetical protein
MDYGNEQHGFHPFKQKELGTPEKTRGCPTIKEK